MDKDTAQNIHKCEFANGACIHCEATEREECEGWICPPKRPWVGLTDEELWDTAGYKEDRESFRFARAIEAKLKEKNQ
jgi:hypothetical protein